MALKPVVERLAMEMSLPVFTIQKTASTYYQTYTLLSKKSNDFSLVRRKNLETGTENVLTLLKQSEED